MRTLAKSLAIGCFIGFLALGPLQKAHAVPLLSTFGGPAGYGSNSLAANDDGSSSALSLAAAFPSGLRFFGGPYNTVYINNNGNITFSGPVPTYTPSAFPIAAQPMIAPYWGDVDTRGARDANNNMVYWHLEPGRLIATWHNVGVYSYNDTRRMDFQLIVTNALGCGSGDFDVEFRYNRCEWEAGRASGDTNNSGICDAGETTCVPAQAGFDAGNTTDFVEIPGSRTPAIRDLCTTSNVGMPGIWRYSVRGGMVSCPGTGEPCDTGMPGACGVGVTACVGREERCVQLGTSSAERCDGVDNDCNGTIDDGSLCSSPNICVSGTCVPPCFEGGCNPGETCNAQSICVETACETVSCPSGQRCRGGTCVGACEGIVCPHGQQCAAGRCQDLCDLLTCGAEEVCVDGSCRPMCPCYPCGPGETCLADGTCESAGCDVVLCDPGFYCQAGTCLDACAGVSCPSGQRCEVGDCVDIPPMPDAGPPPPFDGGGLPGTDGGGTTMMDGGGAGTDAGRTGPIRRGGCGCTVPTGSSAPHLAWALGLVALIWRRRR